MKKIKLFKNFEFSIDLFRTQFIVLIPTITIFTGNLTYKYSIEFVFLTIQIGIGKRRY
jgi:hypothetical protein